MRPNKCNLETVLVEARGYVPVRMKALRRGAILLFLLAVPHHIFGLDRDTDHRAVLPYGLDRCGWSSERCSCTRANHGWVSVAGVHERTHPL